MSVLDIVHNVRPSLERNHQKDRRPGHSDVVERDGVLKGVVQSRPALGVVLVPVDAARIVRLVAKWGRPSRFLARQMIVPGRRQVIAPMHAVILVQAAYPVLVAVLVLVIRGDRAATHPSVVIELALTWKSICLVAFIGTSLSVASSEWKRSLGVSRVNRFACQQ